MRSHKSPVAGGSGSRSAASPANGSGRTIFGGAGENATAGSGGGGGGGAAGGGAGGRAVGGVAPRPPGGRAARRRRAREPPAGSGIVDSALGAQGRWSPQKFRR